MKAKHPNAGGKEMTKLLGVAWKGLDAQGQKPYKEKAVQMAQEYNAYNAVRAPTPFLRILCCFCCRGCVFGVVLSTHHSFASCAASVAGAVSLGLCCVTKK